MARATFVKKHAGITLTMESKRVNLIGDGSSALAGSISAGQDRNKAIRQAKQFRKDADELLQRMKAHTKLLRVSAISMPEREPADDMGEVIAQHILSTRDLESCIMRQGMTLKYIGTPDPYPESRNPESPRVEPTADNLKM